MIAVHHCAEVAGANLLVRQSDHDVFHRDICRREIASLNLDGRLTMSSL